MVVILMVKLIMLFFLLLLMLIGDGRLRIVGELLGEKMGMRGYRRVIIVGFVKMRSILFLIDYLDMIDMLIILQFELVHHHQNLEELIGYIQSTPVINLLFIYEFAYSD